MYPGRRHKPVILRTCWYSGTTTDLGLDVRMKCVGIPYHSTDFQRKIGSVRSYRWAIQALTSPFVSHYLTVTLLTTSFLQQRGGWLLQAMTYFSLIHYSTQSVRRREKHCSCLGHHWLHRSRTSQASTLLFEVSIGRISFIQGLATTV